MKWRSKDFAAAIIDNSVRQGLSNKEIIKKLDESVGEDNYDLQEAIEAIKQEREFRKKVDSYG